LTVAGTARSIGANLGRSSVTSCEIISWGIIMKSLSGIIAATMCAACLPAFAQNAAGGGEGATLEEVVITAEKRTENLQKVSISVATVSGEEITEQGQNNIEDILKNVSSVVVIGTARGAAVSIRGLGFDLPPQVGEGSVSMNFDGVYNFRSESATTGYFDLNRVEVLRGPQGTLYGRNATGGVVNIISNNPGKEFQARGTVEAGSYNLLRTEGAINMPLSESWSTRAAFVSINRDGVLSDGHNDAVGSAARFKALYQPSEDFSILTSIEAARIGGVGPGTANGAAFDANPLLGTDIAGASNYFRSTRYTVQLDWNVGPGVLTVLPGYQSAVGYNYAGGMGPQTGTLVRTYDPIYAKQKSAEVRYSSTADATLKWVGGAFYYDKDDLGEALGGVGNQTKSYAVFGQVTYPVADRFRLIAGVRESRDKKSFNRLTPLPPPASNAASDERDAFDWKAGMEFDAAPASMLYLTVATGHRPGGFNVLADNMAALVTPGQFFSPESLLSFELGAKNRFLNDRVQLNGAAFFYDYKDYQLADIYAFVPALAAQFVNADARIKGAEVELQTVVGRGGQFDLGGTFLDGKLKEPVVRNGVTVFSAGDTLSHSPRSAAKAGFQYQFPTGNGATITPRFDYRYTADQYVNAVNNAADLQKAYSTYDASIMYRGSNGKWSLNFYGKNLSNEVVKLFLAGPNPQVSMPRTYGVVFSMTN
jgi:iron complex outermembrane receptor protein